MVTHFYVNFQCDECDYCGDNEMTIAVHEGKNIVKTRGDLKEHVKGKHAERNKHFKCIDAKQGRTFHIKLSVKHILCLNFSQNFSKTELHPGSKEESQICLLRVPSGNLCI